MHSDESAASSHRQTDPSRWGGSNGLSILRAPGGLEELVRTSDGLQTNSGRHFPLEEGILRVLGEADPLLAKEIAAQAQAIDEYLDPDLLMPRYESEFVVRLAIEELLPETLNQLSPDQPALDVGCGVGIVGRLYPQVGWVGLDASMDLLRHAGVGYEMLIEGSAEALPFKDQSFELVIALNMLHHVINPAAAMAEYARVLKPGGTLITVDPRKTTLVEVGKQLLRSKDPAFAETHKAFTTGEYRRLLKADGAFRIERFQQLGLLGLIAMGTLDATRLSKRLPSSDAAVQTLAKLDELLFRAPGVSRLGLNLAARATRV